MSGNLDNLVCTTEAGQLNALAFQGIKVWTCYRQIRDMLQQRFGDSYSLFFTSPVANSDNGSIDWYSPIRGKAVPIASLPPEKAEGIINWLQNAAKEIENLAGELIASNEPLKVTRGHILKLALCYPGNEFLYVIDEQPLIAGWGFGPGTAGVEPMNLSRLAMPASKAAAFSKNRKIDVPASSENTGKRFNPFWLLPLLALLLLLFLLFSSFGPVTAISGKEFFHFSGKPLMADLPDNAISLDTLRNNIVTLEKRVNEHIALCVPEKTHEKVMNPVAERPNMLELPENPTSLEFLSGRWMCETGLASTRTGEAVKVIFNFDGTGQGKATIIEPNDQCVGSASASMADGELHIEMGELLCGKNRNAYGKAAITCANSAARKTLCTGQNFDGTTWGATFLKLR